MQKKILVLGSRSFAARGLVSGLIDAGHEIDTFNRGEVARRGRHVTGSVLELCGHAGLADRYDMVVNYIVLKDCDVAENMAYMAELVNLCTAKKVEQLIHISSVSVYREDVALVRENSAVEQDPSRKGAYGALKVAQDRFLARNHVEGLKVTYVRPGFILGRGLENPMVGMGFQLKAGVILLLGSGKNTTPVTTRKLVNEVVGRLIRDQCDSKERIVLVVDSNSPTRKEWLWECCRGASLGRWVVSLPKFVWMGAGVCGEILIRLLRRNLKPMRVVANICREMTYDSTRSEASLGVSLACDWRKELRRALENEKPY